MRRRTNRTHTSVTPPVTPATDVARSSPLLSRLRQTATERAEAQVTAIERKVEFRALVDQRKRSYASMTKAIKMHDPLQAEPQWLPARFSDRTFAVVNGTAVIVGLIMMFGAFFAAIMEFFVATYIGLPIGFLGLAINIMGTKFEAAEQERRKPEPRRMLTVPSAVHRAYDDYVNTVAVLRAADASEEVVAGIEAQIGFAGELVHEAARLHDAGASDSREARAVRETISDMAANATALVTTAQRHQKAVHASTVADPLLLARAPRNGEFLALSHIIGDETDAARKALARATGRTAS